MNILFIVTLLSPLIAAAIAFTTYNILKITKKQKGDAIILVFYFLVGGIISAAIAFIAIMALSSINDANQGPLSFFFIFGPLSFAFGSLIGLAKFIKNKPKV